VHRDASRPGPSHSSILSQNRVERAKGIGEWAPQASAGSEIARRSFTLLSVATLLCAAGGGGAIAGGAGAMQAPARSETESRSHFVAVVLLGSAVRSEGQWDSAFGGELSAGALCDRCSVAAWAASAGFVGFSRGSRARVSASAAVGTRRVTGLLIGLAGGPVVELDDERRPRAGAEGSLWAFAGVVPYVRVGAVQKGGLFVDIGLRIPLPAGRW
jgi:hypothetical protein